MPTLSAIDVPPGGRRPRSSPDTLATATAEFLARRDLRPRSRTVYGYTLGRLAASVGNDPLLDGFSPDVLSAFMDRWYGDTAPATWNLNLAALRSFGAFGRRQGWLASDPTAGIERRQLRHNPDLRVIPAAELERLWRRNDMVLREKALWRLLYDTAGRAEEVLGLDIVDLDMDAKTAVVIGKGGTRRPVNWYTHTAHLLARLVSGRERGPVFLAQRQPRAAVATADRDPDTGRARLSYRRAAELFTATSGWTLHQLRHTRIRELKDGGCPLPILQKITGHQSLRTLSEHYPGPSPEAVRGWYTDTDPSARRSHHTR